MLLVIMLQMSQDLLTAANPEKKLRSSRPKNRT